MLVNRFNHASGVAAVTPTDRPKSVVWSIFRWCFLCCHVAYNWDFPVGEGTGHKTESYLFLFLLLLWAGRDAQLRTSLYAKRDYFNFHITNFPFLNSYIQSSSVYGVFISRGLMSGISSLKNVWIRGRRDFNISFSNMDMSGNVWNRLLRSSMIVMGISSSNMTSPSPKCHIIFWDITINSYILYL